MTAVRVRLALRNVDAEAGRNQASGALQFRPTSRRVDDGDVILPKPFTVVMRAGQEPPVVSFELDDAATWAWQALERVTDGRGDWVTFTVADVTPVEGDWDVNYCDLTLVDPDTLTPVPDAPPTVQEALDLKANTADLGTAAAEDVGAFATAAQGTTADSTAATIDSGRLSEASLNGAYATVAQIAPGVKLYNAKGLRRFSAALSDALLGACAISVYGDSISSGVGSDGNSGGSNHATWRTSGWVAQLRALFAAQFGDPGEGVLSIFDTGAITYGGGASTHNSSAPYKAGNRAVGNTQTITVAVSAGTTVEFWTWDGGSGTASVTVDGASTGFSLNGGGSGSNTFSAGAGNTSATTCTKHTITGMSAATHSLVFTGPSGGTLYLSAVAVHKSSTGVRVHRISKSGNTSNNLLGQDIELNGNAAGQARVLAMTAKFPTADLLVLPIGFNDFGNQNTTAHTAAQPGTTPTTYAANMQAVVNQAITNGACVLLVGEPRGNSSAYPSPMTYTEQQYWDAAKAIAQATDHCAFLDIGDLWGTNVQGQVPGFYTASSVHPTRKGHGSIARLIHRALTIPEGENAPAT